MVKNIIVRYNIKEHWLEQTVLPSLCDLLAKRMLLHKPI